MNRFFLHVFVLTLVLTPAALAEDRDDELPEVDVTYSYSGTTFYISYVR